MDKIKENFIAFLALYMFMISTGMFTTMDYFHAENAFSKIPSCDFRDAGNSDACTCSCNMESAKECHCCSGHTPRSFTDKVAIDGCTCNEAPGDKANFITFKYLPEKNTQQKLYPVQQKFLQIKNNLELDIVVSIDHPPSSLLG